MSNVIYEVLIGVASTASAYVIGRKKNKAEVRKIEAIATVNEIEATEKAVAIWRGLAQELKSEVEHLRNLVNELREEIEELKTQNNTLREEMKQYKLQ